MDKDGREIKYEEDPQAYKRARKRQQNRESAVRSRVKKREEVDDLEDVVRRLQEEKAAMETENKELKRQNQYFQDLIANKINVSLPTHDMKPEPTPIRS